MFLSIPLNCMWLILTCHCLPGELVSFFELCASILFLDGISLVLIEADVGER